jgi:hypothetical protein
VICGSAGGQPDQDVDDSVETGPESGHGDPRPHQLRAKLLLPAVVPGHATGHQRRVGRKITIRGVAHVPHRDRRRKHRIVGLGRMLDGVASQRLGQRASNGDVPITGFRLQPVEPAVDGILGLCRVDSLSCGQLRATVLIHEGHAGSYAASAPAPARAWRGGVRTSRTCIGATGVHHAGAWLQARLCHRRAVAPHGPVMRRGIGVRPCAPGHPGDGQPQGTRRGTPLRCLDRTDDPAGRSRHRTTVPSSQSLTSVQFNS